MGQATLEGARWVREIMARLSRSRAVASGLPCSQTTSQPAASRPTALSTAGCVVHASACAACSVHTSSPLAPSGAPFSQGKNWVNNVGGFVGDGTGTGRNTPTRVSSNETFAALPPHGHCDGGTFTCLDGPHVCAVSTTANLYCWGNGRHGQLGDGRIYSSSNVPLKVVIPLTPLSWRSVSVGSQHTCAITTSNRIFCMGKDDVGMLGDGNTFWGKWYLNEVYMAGVNWKSVDLGDWHSCAISFGGGLYCWVRPVPFVRCVHCEGRQRCIRS